MPKPSFPFFSLLALVTFAAACFHSMEVKAETSATSEAQPNFVWLMSEDNSTHFMHHFDPHGPQTPNIERLAKNGLTFTHAFSNAPVCSVARTTLATGCYGPRIGTQFHRKEVPVPLPSEQHLIPTYLRQIGYYTANNVKTDYNIKPREQVWDESSRKATWRKRRTGQPFFYKQSFAVSHESSLHFPEKDITGKPTKTDPEKVFVPPIHPDTDTFRYTYARYHDNIRKMDQQIGQVVAELEKDGLLEDTFIFYFGDHGGVLPGSKGYAYETGLHVPLVVRIPEKWKHLVPGERGTRIDGFVSFVDFGPTLLHLAGIEIPRGLDGNPFLGEGITLEMLNRRHTTFGYADRFDEKYDLVRTVRKGRYKYMRNYQPFNFDGMQNDYRYKMVAYRQWRELYEAGKLDEVQSFFFRARAPEALYDLETDPYETNNLAEDPAYQEKLAELRTELNQWVKGMPDLSFYPENYLIENAFDHPVAFGRAHRKEIAELVEVADLQLLPFPEAKVGIARALASDHPWKRYWGLIVCSTFARKAADFVPEAKAIAANDPENLNRVRAAEFLGLVGAVDPRPLIKKSLLEADSSTEANLILNTAVLLEDGEPGYDLNFSELLDHPKIEKFRKSRYPNARILYLQKGTD